MEAPIQSDIKTEIKKLLDMVPWLQRGNLKEISLKPNGHAVIVYRSVEEKADGKPVTIRLVKRGQELFLVSDELDVNAQIEQFHYDSVADRLMGYLLDRRPGEKVSRDNMNEVIPKSTSVNVNEAFRKMKHWKVFKPYFMPVCTKHTMQLVDRIIMSPEEAKKFLRDFGVKWQNPEDTA